MRVVIAIDSFKGSLSSSEAGNAVKEAVLKVYDDAHVTVIPLADGGEGTTDVFMSYYNAEPVELTVNGPLMKPVKAKYCIINNTAIMEMASASGLTLISPEERNPLHTTTFGVGEMIKDAIIRGCRRFIIGIGGSATNDGGLGMLSALGFEFLDKNKTPVPNGAKGLEELSEIRTDNVIPELKECVFNIACDVKNPLCGNNGCSAVYGPQKGATPDMVEKMDRLMLHFAEIVKQYFPASDMNKEGAGAAGGLGFAFSSFLNARLRPGIDIIIEESGIEEIIKNSDIVITGEGRLDSQTVMGKAPIGIARLAKKHNKKVIAFAGCVSDDAQICNEQGVDAYFPILRNITTLADALNKDVAYNNLYDTACQVFRLIKTTEFND